MHAHVQDRCIQLLHVDIGAHRTRNLTCVYVMVSEVLGNNSVCLFTDKMCTINAKGNLRKCMWAYAAQRHSRTLCQELHVYGIGIRIRDLPFVGIIHVHVGIQSV